MKYIKSFETIDYKTKIKPNYKKGDEVICVSKNSKLLQHGKTYIVKGITTRGQNNLYYTRVEEGEFHSGKFKTHLDIDSEKYNL